MAPLIEWVEGCDGVGVDGFGFSGAAGIDCD